LIDDGFIYIAQPPKYKFVEGINKFHYLKNDKERSGFEYNRVKKDVSIQSKGINLKQLMSIKEEYSTEFERICNEKSISEEFLTTMMIAEGSDEDTDIDELLEPMELDYEEDTDTITGIYNNTWHDITLEELFSETAELDKITSFNQELEFTYKKDKYKMHIYDFFEFINKKYKFEYTYFKGKSFAPHTSNSM